MTLTFRRIDFGAKLQCFSVLKPHIFLLLEELTWWQREADTQRSDVSLAHDKTAPHTQDICGETILSNLERENYSQQNNG